MNLTETPEVVSWPETHYAFVEKTGPLPQIASEAWQSAHGLVPQLVEQNKIVGYMSLYKMSPNVYRAGFALSAEPTNLPDGLRYEKFRGGEFSRFVLTGPYSDLPQASRHVFEIVSKSDMMLRSDFCIENYVNDPRTTPEEELVTEILVPTA